MESPWDNNDKAFDPMYTETISVKGSRRNGIDVNQNLCCVIYTDETGDPFSSQTVETTREDISISFKKTDWAYVQQIQRGDTLYRPMNDKSYKVKEVKKDVAMGWIIKAREVA